MSIITVKRGNFMYIHLGYLRGQIRLRNPENVNNSDNIGSILKHHRLKLNLTLEDSAEGICSISYLSKIENSLIRPSQKYIDQLEEKYHTNLRFVSTTHTQLLHQLIENLFYQQNELVDISIFDEPNYQTKLNEFGYLVSQHDLTTAREKYLDLNPYVKNLNDLELAFYLFLTAKLLSSQGRIKEAFSILAIPKDTVKNLFLKYLIETERLSLATTMNHHPYISLNYETLMNELIENEFYHKVHEIKFNYMSYLVQFIDEDKLNLMLDKAKSMEVYQKNYLKAKYYFENMQYENSFHLLKDQLHDDIGSYKLAIFVLNRSKQVHTLKQLLVDRPITADNHLNLITEYLLLKILPKTEPEKLVDFIQSKVMKVHDLPDQVDCLIFWYEEGYHYLKKIGYYKDATKLGHLIFRKLKDLSTNFD